jgi:hypothetical protein
MPRRNPAGPIQRLSVVAASVTLAVIAAWLLLVAPAEASPSCSKAGAVVTCTYSYTGGQQLFQAPSGVTNLTIDAVGAAGGASKFLGPGEAGGLGGTSVATVTVTSGEQLYVEVGGTGGVGAGGFNGGGNGGYNFDGEGPGGGGGASDAQACSLGAGGCTDLSALVVAAGGGGGGYGDIGGVGGNAGSPGGSGSNGGGGGGGAGTSTAGGAGGAGGVESGGIHAVGQAGSEGKFGTGGAGSAQNLAGGGGGGGYYGGGGGGSGYEDESNRAASAGGGGGGGFSYAPTGGTTGVATSGETATVTISYTGSLPSLPTASIASPAAGATYSVGQSVATSFSCTEGSGGPGIASCTDSNGASEPHGALNTSTVGSHTYTVTATNDDSQTSTASITYTVAAAPKASIGSPAGGSIYAVGQVVATSFSCTEGAEGSGIESCKDSHGGSGTSGTLDTSTVGSHTYTVTAKSKDGQTGTASITYTVAAAPKASIGSPAAGGTYKVGQTVATSYSCSDGTGGSGIESCVDSHGGSGTTGTLNTTAAGAHTYVVTATSKDGQTSTAEINYTVAAAPTATISSPASGGTYAVGQSVPTSFSCAEGSSGPGISSCTDSNGSSTGSGNLSTAATGSHTYTVTATSKDGQTGTASITYTVAAAPTASIESPASGGTYAVGQSVPTKFSCTEGAHGPGIASCKDSNGSVSPASLDTSTVGAHTYTVTATSGDGQTGTATINYTVAAAPTALISSPTSGNTYAVGQSVPTKFSCAEGAHGPGISSCTDSNGSSTGSGNLSTAATGSHTYTVTATSSDGQTGTASITYTVAAAPTASISSPTSGNTYAVGQVVPTSFSCAEGASGLGLQSCIDSNGASGGTGELSTSTAGPHTYTVTATSKDGQTGTASITYTVIAPPTASIESPAGGGTYAVGQVVATSFSCTEGAEGSGIESCTDANGATSPGALDTSSAGIHTYIVTAKSEDGQEGTAEVTYTVAAAPTAMISSPISGGTYAVGQSVPTSFSCAEGSSGPGIFSCTDSNGSSSPSGSLDTSTAGAHTYTVTATSTDGQMGTAEISYTVAAAPTASIGSPAGGGTYAVGQVVATSFSCSEGAGGSGIESCTDSHGGSGTSGTLDTSTVGAHTYTVTATSKDGQTGEARIEYTVLAPVVPPVVVPVVAPVVAPVVTPIVPPVAAPVVAAAKAPTTTVVAPSDLLVTPKECVSQRKLTIHVVRHVNGMKITSAKVLIAGRVVASLNGSHLIAHLSFAGLRRGAFKVTIVARTSTGSTLTASMIIHTCSA